MLPPETINQFKQFLEQYYLLKINSTLNTTYLTPTNYAAEKKKFLDSSDYNPQFQYRVPEFTDFSKELELTRNMLQHIHLPDDLYSYTEYCLNQLKYQCQAHNLIGTPEFAQAVDQLFSPILPIPQIDTSSIESKIKQYTHQKFFYAPQIQALFKHTLENYHITNYEVIIDGHNPDTIRVGNHRVVIGRQVKRLARDVKRLIIHEIESHVLQRINQTYTEPFNHLTTFADKILYTEGLATYNEISSGLLTPNSYSNYYYRYLAIANRHLSFRKLFQFINQYVPTNRAFIITYRAKRGLSDTSQPGGYPKDVVYLLGYFKIKEFVDQGGDLKSLYAYRNPHLIHLIHKYQLHQTNLNLLLIPKFLLKQ